MVAIYISPQAPFQPLYVLSGFTSTTAGFSDLDTVVAVLQVFPKRVCIPDLATTGFGVILRRHGAYFFLLLLAVESRNLLTNVKVVTGITCSSL